MKLRQRLAATVLAIGLLTAGCGESTDAPDQETGGAPLVGLFRIEPGSCEGGAPAGSHFRMVQPGGTPEAGPFVINGDSSCSDQTITPLSPGSDGGLRTGAHQPQPEPAFDADGNAVSAAIAEPAKWFAVSFALASNPVDPQTGTETAAPSLTSDDGRLTGDLRSVAAAWNGQHFNQGSPKPDGSAPGNTAAPNGTYDETTSTYALDWASQIVGGPFDNFTGLWHLEGTFEPA